MTNAFSALSLKRNRSTPSKKESKFNAMLNKLTSSFHTNKKRRHTDRRSSLSIFIDYFRTEETQDHLFANDALFEHNRYQQQKKQPKCILSPPTNNNNNNKPTSTSILVNNTKKPINHRHTNSTPVIPTTARRNNNKSHARHYSHVSCISSSNITVNSEDLTAKEFADIAGIRILSEQDEQVTHRCDEKICTFCGDNDRLPSLIVTSRISNSSMIRSSDNSSIYYGPEEEEEPQIWDNQFWTRPGNQQEMPAILHELKNNQDTYLKKGRFEIHLSSSSMASLPLPAPVYEWKRKTRQSTLEQHVTA
ncbi:hypothetical protein BDF21DRAFT_428203 [Thamnidium elegans]|uniref:Uncharacterized protein n=1 Tax=Thamnidium elegans TaxID=101142 RepID=A0A8H7VT41_9FUNG|nr:hypothetical protein INT48_001854 [Thamnidium elegans]KAI8064094.1 hypothetical protein BDF21DRAFT_428203 [Thamnidium elegans]